MTKPHVYDKAKYHDQTISDFDLPEEHSYNHTTYFLKWMVEHDMMGGIVTSDFFDELKQCKDGKISINEFYEILDCCFVDDMLSDEGNKFAMAYFNFDNGKYINDYIKILQKELPSEFHVVYNEENYDLIKKVISMRYSEWKSGKL